MTDRRGQRNFEISNAKMGVETHNWKYLFKTMILIKIFLSCDA